jgi:glycosyltransferase involved in cell wall biosynthesis
MVVYASYPLGETRVQREAEALVAAGFEVDVICTRNEGEPPRAEYQHVQIHRLPVRIRKAGLARQFVDYLRFFVLATIKLTRLHRQRRYGTIQVHNLPDFLVFCAVLPKLRGVPIVLDLHDLMPEFFRGRFGDRHRALQRLIILQERWACRFADHVITVSEHWRETLRSRGVDPDKCSVVMNLADESVFVAGPRRHVPDRELRLLYHGTVTYRYGLDLAVRAVALLRDGHGEDVHLTILGLGDQMADLAGLVSELRLEGHVELRNEILPAEDLPPIIDDADLGVVPYRNDVFTDGLVPTKLMEYAVMGLPCVAARTTVIEHYFRDSMVEFFEPGDAADLARAVHELRASPGRLERLARGSTRFTDRYNWRSAGRAYVELIRRLAPQCE